MKALFYTPVFSGLANRLRGLAGYQAMARCLDLEFYLCWVPNQDCDAEFDQLFDVTAYNLVAIEDRERFGRQADVMLFDDKPTFSQLWDSHLRGIVTWEVFSHQALTCLRGLRPVTSIESTLRTFSAAHHLADTPGVHIRWTDNLAAYENWVTTGPSFDPQRVSQLAGFERFVDDYLTTHEGSKVFLATDNSKVLKRFLALFGNRLVAYPKRYRRSVKVCWQWQPFKPIMSVQRTSSIQDALLEMLLLAECRLLVSTYYSSYAEIAALRGNRPLMQMQGAACVEIAALPAPESPL